MHYQPSSASFRSDSSSNDQVPDSTTSDLAYDSDAFNSEDSCSSFAEAQQMSTSLSMPPLPTDGAHASAPSSFHNLFSGNKHKTTDEDSSSSSYESRPRKNLKKAKKAGDTLLKCDYCVYTTRFKEHLTSHMNTHATTRNYMCSDCGQTFKWSHSLKRHQRTHAPSSDFRYTCKFCLKTFQRKDHLSIHESLHTSTGTSFPCSECGATFKNKKTLTGHIKTHNTEKAFKCGQCDSEFTRKASLNRHIRAAHAGHVLSCPLCPAVFSYRNTLEDHKKAAHNEGRREYGCDLCGVQFAVKAYLSKHMITCKNRAVGKSFPCSLCAKSFPTKRHLNDHHKRKHPANQPGKPLTEPSSCLEPVPSDPPSMTPLHQSQPSFSTYDSSYYHYQNCNDPYAKNGSSQLLGHDLPLPQMSNPVMEEDHNVGSLLRLVYSCPDPMEAATGSSADNPPSASSEYLPPANDSSHASQTRPICPELLDYSSPQAILDGISLDYL